MGNFNIGKALYKERQKRHLTQKEFVGGIISVSQYSRVESGEQDLRASTFLKLLQFNHININQISDQQLNNDSLENKELNSLAIAFYNKDLDKINKIKANAEKYSKDETVLLNSTLMISILENNLENIDSKILEKFSKKLADADNWTTDKVFLQLFGSSMMLFDMERLNIYMRKILKKYIFDIDQYSFEVQRKIGAICINYLGRSYKEKNRQYLDDILLLLDHMSAIPDLLMYKLLGKYFKALFDEDSEKVKRILNLLKYVGYEKFIINLPK